MLPLCGVLEFLFVTSINPLSCLPTDVDDEYEDEDQWEDGAEDILEKGSLMV